MSELADLFSFNRISGFSLRSPADAVPGDALWPQEASRRRTAIFAEADQTTSAWQICAAELLFDRGAFREAIEHAEQVSGSERDEVRALACMANCALCLGDGEAADTYLRQLMAKAEESVDAYVEATAHLIHGRCRERNLTGHLTHQIDPEARLDSLQLFRRAARLFEDLGEFTLSLAAQIEYADLKLANGEYVAALEVVEQGLRTAQRTEAWSMIGRLMLVAGKAGIDQGYRQGVEQALERSMEWAEYFGDAGNRIMANFARGRLLAFEMSADDRVALARADAFLRRASEEAEALDMAWVLAATDNVRAWAHRKAGDHVAARKLMGAGSDDREAMAAERHEASERVTLAIKERISTRLQDGVERAPDAFFVFDALRNEAGEVRDFLNEYRNLAAIKLIERDSTYVCLFSEIRNLPIMVRLTDPLFHAVRRRVAFEDILSLDVDESTIWFQRQVIPSGDGAVLTLRDVTAERRIEEALREAAEISARSERTKSAFLANMSHEMRTPLNDVLGLARMLAETDLSDTQRNYLSEIVGSSGALLDLIGEVLDITRLDVNEMRLIPSPVVLEDIVGSILKLYRVQAEQKGVGLRATITPDVPHVVLTDGGRLRQILANLVANGVKFTHQGEVTLSVTKFRDLVEFTIRDTGIGIPPDRLRVIFDRFHQLAGPHAFGGTGLGLTVAEALAELMGGRIQVTSTLGQGSTFVFRLPMVEAEMEAKTPVSHTFDDTRVLVVDDNRINLLVSAHALKKLGCDVSTAPDGRAALNRLGERQFDLVLMDVRMPVLDGPAATRELRAREARLGAARTPVIALTTGALSKELEECLAAGMDDYVTKSFTDDSLREALTRWLHAFEPAV